MSTQFFIRPRRADHVLLASVLFLTSIGLVTLYTASYAFAESFFKDGNYFISRQLVFCAVGIVLFFAASIVNLDFVRKLSKPLVWVAIVLCILTFVPGIRVIKNGAARWIGIGSSTYQPSELVKLVLPLYLADYFDRKRSQIDNFSRGILPATLVAVFFSILIFLQNNLSTTIFLLLNAMVVFFLAGVKFRYLLGALFMGIPVGVLMVLQKEHRVRRFLSYIRPDFDPQGAGYQVNSSLITLSSGGFWGKGLGEGIRKVASVPEVQSDFIFAAFAEEAGFLGVILFCALFGVFAVRGYTASMKSERVFNRLLGCGLVTMIVSQALLNIGVAAGALPPTGIPLPFFSAGGSSLVTTLIMAGLVVNVSRSPKEPVRPLKSEEGPPLTEVD